MGPLQAKPVRLRGTVSVGKIAEPMKLQIVLFSYVLLLSPFLASTHLLVLSKQGCFHGVTCSPLASPCERLNICEKVVKANDVVVSRPSRELEDDGGMELMGSEECYQKDGECLSRRIIAEAHLDYIYTQHQKP